ncbi:hypothetical protein [Methylobacterium durans]|nr:hypothetical protein [Methylobacterium durans]
MSIRIVHAEIEALLADLAARTDRDGAPHLSKGEDFARTGVARAAL